MHRRVDARPDVLMFFGVLDECFQCSCGDLWMSGVFREVVGVDDLDLLFRGRDVRRVERRHCGIDGGGSNQRAVLNLCWFNVVVVVINWAWSEEEEGMTPCADPQSGCSCRGRGAHEQNTPVTRTTIIVVTRARILRWCEIARKTGLDL